jgi:hypothetical protein
VSRDHRADRPQIVYGLLCTRDGLPVAIEVFEGDIADPRTLSSQIEKLKRRIAPYAFAARSDKFPINCDCIHFTPSTPRIAASLALRAAGVALPPSVQAVTD